MLPESTWVQPLGQKFIRISLDGQIDGDAVEQRRGKITFAGIGQHAQDIGARGGAPGHLQRAGKCGARGNTDEDTFLSRQRPGAAQRDLAGLSVLDEVICRTKESVCAQALAC